MRLFKLEMKRVIKSKKNVLLICIALCSTIFFACLSIFYEGRNIIGKSGEVEEIYGLEAIRYEKERQKRSNGVITEKKMQEALETYQKLVKKYGSVEKEDFPLDVYNEKILPILPLLDCLSEVYGNPETGGDAKLEELNVENVINFYEDCQKYFKIKMAMYEDHVEKKGIEKYQGTTKKFSFYSGYSQKFTFDFLEQSIFIIILVCIVMAATIFSDEYETGADLILRCTKYGRRKLGLTKVCVMNIILILLYIICIVVYLLITNIPRGWNGLKTSVQLVYSTLCMSNICLGELEVLVVLVGLLTLGASLNITLFISSYANSNLISVMLAMLFLFTPCLIYTALGENWLTFLLPSGGIGVQNDFLYQYTHWNYLSIGKFCFWIPDIIVVVALLEIPIFIILTMKSYSAHKSLYR